MHIFSKQLWTSSTNKKKPYELLEKKKFQIILSLCTKHTYSMHMLRVLEKARKNEGKQPTVYIYIIRCFTVDDPFSHSLITSKNARSKIYWQLYGFRRWIDFSHQPSFRYAKFYHCNSSFENVQSYSWRNSIFFCVCVSVLLFVWLFV